MIDFSFKMVDFSFKMVDFSFKTVAFSWKMLGFSFKMVDFSFKTVDFSGLRTGWRRAEGGAPRALPPRFWGIYLPHRRSLGRTQQRIGMADAIHWG